MANWNPLSFFGWGAGKRVPGTQSIQPSSGQMTTRAVNDDTALQISTVWACVRLIAETVAGLPLNFYERQAGGKLVAIDAHPVLDLLKYKPNRYQTSAEFWETLVYQLAFRGNAYCAKGKTAKNELISLLPLMTAQMQTELGTDGSVQHFYADGKNTVAMAEATVWHTKLFGNGIIGMSPLDYARNSIGVSMSVDERVNKLANGGFKPTGVLTIDKVLSPEQRIAIRKNFSDLASGGDDVLRVLEAGMTYQQISMNPKDVQLFETRQFQTEDIARFFGVPSVLVNDMSKSTVWGSGISEIIRGFYKLGVRPYLHRLQESILINLLTTDERRKILPRFDFDALLRGTEKERYEGYQVAIRSGVMTPNEARAEEGLSPSGSGDKLFIDRQLVFLENGGLDNGQA